MKKILFIFAVCFGYIMSLQPTKKKVVRQIQINVVPSYSNLLMSKADSG